MKSRSLFGVVSLVAMSIFLLGFSTNAPAETVTLTYANFFPPVHIQSQLAEAWCKEVEKRTNGAVKINYFPGGTLVKAPQIYDGVEQGIADIGMSVFAYTAGRFPVAGAIDLPLGYSNGVTATKVANAVLAKFNPQEFTTTKVMYLHAHGPGYIHTRAKAVHNLADLKGLKIRATGMSAKMVAALGATPVGMGMPDTYQSLQKGVVDGSAHPLESNKGWKLVDVLENVIAENSVAYTTAMFVTMNKTKWDALSPEVQKTITEINGEWAAKHGEAWDQIDQDGQKLLVEKGRTIITLDPAEAQKWQAAVQPAIATYIAELDQKGIKGQEIVDFIKATISGK